MRGATMSHSVLLMSTIPHLVRAEHDAVFRVEASAASGFAAPAADVPVVYVGAQVVYLVAKEADYGTCC